jgi:N-acetylneuraminic acid mutarotase
MSITGIYKGGGGGTRERTFIASNLASNVNGWGARTAVPYTYGIAAFAIATLNNKIYCIGGLGTNVSTNYIYDTVTDTWSTGAAMPAGRAYISGVCIGTKIYCIGGDNGGPTNTTYIYDTATNTWSTGSTMPAARHSMWMSYVGTKIYCIGGDGGSPTNTNYIYDTTTDTWSTGAAMPGAKNGGDLTTAVGTKIYCIGGYNNGAQNTNYIYDTATNTWSTGVSIPSARYNVSSITYNGKLYCVAGYINGTAEGSQVDVRIYDTATNTWSTGVSIPSKRDAAGVIAANGGLYCIGGRSGANNPQTNNYRYLYAPTKTISIFGRSTGKFDRVVLWDGVSKPANTEFTTENPGILTFSVSDVTGTITEKIEQSVTIN